MNKIGFKNFRRFINFEPIEFNGITFLVGRNNAGKSTLVKALLLINDYLKSGDISKFDFGSIALEDTNIVTYGRAKNRKSKNEDFIEFVLHEPPYLLEIIISGDEDKTTADVHSVLISDRDMSLDFYFKPLHNSVTISKKRAAISSNIEDVLKDQLFSDKELGEIQSVIDLKNKLKVEENRLKKEIKASKLNKASREYIAKVAELSLIKNKKGMLSISLEKENKDESLYSITVEYDNGKNFMEIIEFAVSHAIIYHNLEFPEIQSGKGQSKDFINNRAVKEDERLIIDSFTNLYIALIELPSIYYLGSNAIKQAALFPIRDKNNSLAQAIHDFYQLKISPGEAAYEFVLKWMKIFEVGDSFEIIIHAGEAYEVRILSNNTMIHLADKGMGSIQAMLLILRMASIIHKTLNKDKVVTVIIEEPELNLHPALQSRLTDLFFDVYENYFLWFIVETHSEYVLRRSQVLVAEKELGVSPNVNPFCVQYFPKEIEQPAYRLTYQEDGSFNRNFGEGFFDEASGSTLELIKLKRLKK